MRALALALAPLVCCSPPPADPASPGSTSSASLEPPTSAVSASPTMATREASCDQVTTTFGFKPMLGGRTKRYGFPETLSGPQQIPILEGTMLENAATIEKSVASYEAARTTLAVQVRAPADAFAAAVRARATKLRQIDAKMKAADAASSGALVDAACFGMTAMVNDQCPYSALAADLEPIGNASDAVNAVCGAR